MCVSRTSEQTIRRHYVNAQSRPPHPAGDIETECPVNSLAPKKIISDSFGGTHHCIATGHAVVDMVFRYLRASCNSRGGRLTDSELATARLELLERFTSAFDIFDAIHQTCMDASGATATMAFSQDKILSSLLRACSKRSAAHVFSNEISRQGSDWLSLFYDAFSESIQRHVNLNAERRLTNAYAEAAGKLGQTLSIKKLLSEQAIQKVLRECALPFEAFGPSSAMAARLGSELNDYIAKDSEHALNSGKITDSQIQKFLTLFPREVYIALKMATPTESAA